MLVFDKTPFYSEWGPIGDVGVISEIGTFKVSDTQRRVHVHLDV